MNKRLSATLLKLVTSLVLGYGMPLIAYSGILSGGCDAGVEYDCVAEEWLGSASGKSPTQRGDTASAGPIDHIISPELRRRLDEHIEKEQKEFEKFLTDARNQPMTRGLQTAAPLPNKPTPDISYNPLAERLADSHIAEIQTSLQTELDKRANRSSSANEEWFEPVTTQAAPKVYDTVYEKPFLMKVLERLYAFEMADFIILVVLLAITRVLILPFTRF